MGTNIVLVNKQAEPESSIVISGSKVKIKIPIIKSKTQMQIGIVKCDHKD